MSDIKDYWLNKLLLPRTFIIDQPGIIISKVSSKFGDKENKRRMVFFFEDIFVGLQLETIKLVGESKTNDLWYKIGKDIAYQFLLNSKTKRVNKLLFPNVLSYILKGFYSGGQRFVKTFGYNLKKEQFKFEGENNIFCRKTANGEFNAGLASGMISFFMNKNLEAKSFCSCPTSCKIVVGPTFPFRYSPNLKNMVPDELYFKLNFPEKTIIPKKAISFKDMVEFKKIISKNGEWCVKDKSLIPGEAWMGGLIFKNYADTGLESFFEKTIASKSKLLAKELFPEKTNSTNTLESLLNLYSSFGNGNYFYKIDKKEIFIRLTYAPYHSYGFNYVASVIKGFLEFTFNKEFVLRKMNFDKQNYSLYLTYT